MHGENIRKRIDELLERAYENRYIDSKYTLEISNEAISLCKQINYKFGEKVAELYMSHSYSNIGNYEKAFSLVFNSIHYFINEGFHDLQWMSYNTLGILFYDLGDIERSMESYDNAQATALKIDFGKKYHKDFSSKKSVVLTLNNIAENYKLIKNYEEALKHCEKAYNIDKQFDYSLSKGVIVLSLGQIYYEIGDYEKADILAHESLQYLKKYKCVIAIADAYNLMALTSWEKGIYEKADEYFHIAVDLNEKESVPNYRIDALVKYFEYLKDQEKTTEALEVLTEACNISIEYNLPEKVSDISIKLSIFYGDLGDYKNALKYSKLHYSYEEKYTETYYKNIVNNLNIKKKMKQFESENNKIIEKNKTLKMQRQSLQTLVEKISIISKLGQKITSTLNMDSLMEIIYSSIKSFINLSYFAFGLYDEENCTINYLYAIDRGQKIKKDSVKINNGQSFAGRCIKSKELIVINNTGEEFPQYIDQKTYKHMLTIGNNSDLNSLIFCPLIVNTKIIGIITIQNIEKDAFTPYHIEMIKSLSAYAAIAINNAIKSSELERLNEMLLSLSEKDKLTGIANRRKLDEYISHIWNKSAKDKTSIALLIIDIDYFKQYNDNLGHLEGDRCIADVANILSNLSTRPYLVARYGGDEFMIVLPNSCTEDAVKFGESIKIKVLEQNISHKYSKVSDRVTLSIGIASLTPDKNITINDLIRKADEALYTAKKSGRNQVVAYEN